MNHKTDEPAVRVSPAKRSGPLSLMAKAGWAAGVAFILTLGIMKVYHPVLMTRHLERVLGQCTVVGVVAFFTAWFIYSVNRSEK